MRKTIFAIEKGKQSDIGLTQGWVDITPATRRHYGTSVSHEGKYGLVVHDGARIVARYGKGWQVLVVETPPGAPAPNIPGPGESGRIYLGNGRAAPKTP